MYIRFSLFFFLLISVTMQAMSQAGDMDPRNGKTLPCHGTIRVLLVFAEMEYDVHPANDPCAQLTYTQWQPHQLPQWKDNFFSPTLSDSGKGRLTQFYAESSFNNFMVLGDYYPYVITLKESEVKAVSDPGFHVPQILQKITAQGEWKSGNGLPADSFDLWTFTSAGQPKITPSTDSPRKIDHVMFIMRNMINLKDANGRAAPGSCGRMGAYAFDSYSIFGANNTLPFNICRHEFTHLFLGDNNFHTGGGGEKFGGGSYQMGIQGMWSVIGAAFSSLMTCNAWDRHRLGWKPDDKKYFLSCRDTLGDEIATDFNDSNTTKGVYVVRDFVTTGDAIRIKLPYLPENEFQQYLWIENHQTNKFNKSNYDRFQYEPAECVEPAQPGLYMYLQIDKDCMSGPSIYSGYAEYFRPLPARGCYDYIIDTNMIQNNCINSLSYYSYEIDERMSNPLTGSHSLEAPVLNVNNNARLEQTEVVHTNIEKREGTYIKHLLQYGNGAVAFRTGYRDNISMCTNPSTANALSCVQGMYNINKQNNRTIYMNGISVAITAVMPDGAIVVEIGNDNNLIDKNIRLCADSIILPKIPSKGNTIYITPKTQVLADRGTTPTWPVKCDSVNTLHKFLFTQTTKLTLPAHCTLVMQKNSRLTLDNESKFYIMEGSKIIIEKGAVLELKNGSRLIAIAATIELKKGALLKIKGKKNFILDNKTILKQSAGGQIIFKN